MKVAYINMQFPAPSETFAAIDVRALSSTGTQVTVFSLKPPHEKKNQMVTNRHLENVPVFDCGFAEIVKGLFYCFYYPIIFFRLFFWILISDFHKPRHMVKSIMLIPSGFYILKNLIKLNPDVVHLFWGHYPSIVGFLVKQKLPEARLSMFLGAYDIELNLGISKKIALKADYIFTHSKANLYDLKKNINPDINVNVVHRGIYLRKYPPFSRIIKEKDPNLLLSAGRFIPEKGFDKVIKIFNEILKEHPGSMLKLAGDGPELNNLKKLTVSYGIEDKVEFLGWLKQDELIKELVRSQIFLLASTKKGERLPNVVKEAMATGCVCIISDSPGLTELIEHGKTGYIFNTVDFLKAAETAKKYMGCKQVYDLQKKAFKFIHERFSADKSMLKYVTAWKEQ